MAEQVLNLILFVLVFWLIFAILLFVMTLSASFVTSEKMEDLISFYLSSEAR